MKFNEYNELSAAEIADIIRSLRILEIEELRKTAGQQSYILRNISPEKLVEVVRLLKPSGLAKVLGGAEVSDGK